MAVDEGTPVNKTSFNRYFFFNLSTNFRDNRSDDTHLFKMISDAPFVNSLYPPPFLGMTVLMDLRSELKVNTLVNVSSGMSSLTV